MTAADQQPHKPGTDGAGGAGNKDAHGIGAPERRCAQDVGLYPGPINASSVAFPVTMMGRGSGRDSPNNFPARPLNQSGVEADWPILSARQIEI
jgi:hypothetical protein